MAYHDPYYQSNHGEAPPDFSSRRYSNSAPHYSDLSYGAPMSNHAQTASQPPYNPRTSYSGGPTALEPQDIKRRSGIPPGGQAVQSDWMSQQRESSGGMGDIGMVSNLPPAEGYAYHDTPYDSRDQDYDQADGSRRLGRAPSSVGPWDSASQAGDSVDYPLPHPSSAALSDVDGSGRHVGHKASYAGGLSYIDEEGAYYHSNNQRPGSEFYDNGYSNQKDDYEMRGLVSGAANMAKGDDLEDGRNVKFAEYNDAPYTYPPEPSNTANMREPSALYSLLLFPTGLDRLLALFCINAGKFPIEQAVERKRHGIGGQRWPVASWALAAVMCGLMVYELLRNNSLTGSPIATKPSFNYMIGPTAEVLINVGARFPPCMKYVEALPPTFQLACLNDTSSTPTTSCSLETICGHGGFPSGTPDQSWRFVYPIFLHVGIIHLLLNMLAQVTASAQVEREMGTIPFLIVYMAGGIYGFVLGGNFSRTGIPSVGASGALFATNACVLVDLILHWKYEERPKLRAFLLALEFIIGFAIGYIPNAVDGLAHLGGWAMGILFGIILYPSISETKRHRYTVWAARVIAIPLIILAFVLTIKNFYTDDPNAACEWCRYLSCIPVKSNTYCKGTGITVSTTNSTNTRRWEL